MNQSQTHPVAAHPSWVQHAIFWQVYPLGFAGVPIREQAQTLPEPRGLRRLIGWLDHAVELGCSGLLLGPIFASQTHGYDTTDHLRIDPRLGTDEDFDDLVAACRQRGLRLVLDGVFSHVGTEHPLLQLALSEQASEVDRELFDLAPGADGRLHPRVFEGHDSLPRLNHDSPRTRNWVQQIMCHWLDRGADGWRLDAAYSVAPAFWQQVLPAVREHHPQCWLLGEVIHGDYPAIVADSRLDTLTQYELWKAIWSSLKDANFYELDWCLRRNNELLDHFVPQTFIGNHDVTRIATMVGPQRARAALVILMTVAGIPSIYYGDEYGAQAVKEERIGGDDAVRPSFPADPTVQAVDWSGAAPEAQDWMRLHQELIGIRRRHPWLVRAPVSVEQLSNTELTYLSTGTEPEHWLRVELGLEPQVRAIITDASGELFRL